MERTPFYASGLKFSCKRCSACCRYDAGFVYLSQIDLQMLLDAVKMDKNEFITEYCRWVIDWSGEEVLSLKEKSNRDCVFWENGCKVYSKRPLQCSTFPFWENIISSRESWEIAAAGCPGINTGDLFSEYSISENLYKRAAQPIINKTDMIEKQGLRQFGGNV